MPTRPTPPPVLLWRDNDSTGQRKRVWQATWAGDMFEVLSEEEFASLVSLCSRLSIALVEADD